jgi:hypothetical protein
MRSENALIVANGDYVMPHGFTNIGQHVNWIAADIVRIEDGRLAEHWDHPGRSHPGRVQERPADVQSGIPFQHNPLAAPGHHGTPRCRRQLEE